MDKVKNVSISGFVFSLDKEADNILKTYLDTLSAYYASRTDGQEIMEGIENRIAELLLDRGCKTNVVTAALAKEVTGIIGSPDVLCETEKDAEKKTCSDSIKKRLYRNPDSKIIAGACGGLGVYFNTDPVWIRLGFAVLCILGIICSDWIDIGGPTIPMILYCILWIAMPMAKTTRQKCEMRGESLSYEEIERNVAKGQGKNAPTESTTSGIITVLLKMAVVFIGFILIIVGLSGILALVCAIFGLSIVGLALPGFLSGIAGTICSAPQWSVIVMKILSMLVVFIPFAALLYGGIKTIFHLDTPRWKPGLAMLFAWLLSVIALLIVGLTSIPGILNACTSI